MEKDRGIDGTHPIEKYTDIRKELLLNNVNNYFKKHPWSIDNWDYGFYEGLSFLAIPYKLEDGRIENGIVIGPLKRKIAEWILELVNKEQLNNKDLYYHENIRILSGRFGENLNTEEELSVDDDNFPIDLSVDEYILEKQKSKIKEGYILATEIEYGNGMYY